MTGDVVCNASPLIFLAKIKRLELLDIYSLYRLNALFAVKLSMLSPESQLFNKKHNGAGHIFHE
jgi:hypothetical protein